jgi:hypothetical protein
MLRCTREVMPRKPVFDFEVTLALRLEVQLCRDSPGGISERKPSECTEYNPTLSKVWDSV